MASVHGSDSASTQGIFKPSQKSHFVRGVAAKADTLRLQSWRTVALRICKPPAWLTKVVVRQIWNAYKVLGKPVAHDYALLWLIYGLLSGILAYYFGLLGFLGRFKVVPRYLGLGFIRLQQKGFGHQTKGSMDTRTTRAGPYGRP